MKPYYRKNGITLYHGDSARLLAELPAGTFGALLTDPPYSSGGQFRGDRALPSAVSKYVKQKSLYQSFSGDNRDQRSFSFWMQSWLTDCRRILAPGDYALVFSDWRQLPTVTDAFQGGGLVWRGVVPWDKGRGTRSPHKGYFRHQCEYLIWGTNGPCVRRTDLGPGEGCLRFPVKAREKRHAVAKPIALLRQIVAFIPEAATVCDPFVGSGTTLKAAQQLGRRAIGIECDEHACETAARWLDEENEQTPIGYLADTKANAVLMASAP